MLRRSVATEIYRRDPPVSYKLCRAVTRSGIFFQFFSNIFYMSGWDSDSLQAKMPTLIFILFILLIDQLSNATEVSQQHFVHKESMKTRANFRKRSNPEPTDIHEVLISVAQNNLSYIESTLDDRGNPNHPSYQHWLTFEEIGNLTVNRIAFDEVMNWLIRSDTSVIWQSPRYDYIRAVASISIWQTLLNAKFYVWEDVDASATRRYYTRAPSYSLPSHISPHIIAIFNTCQSPPIIQYHAPTLLKASDRTDSWRTEACSSASPCDVNIAFLNNLYQITSNIGRHPSHHFIIPVNVSYARFQVALASSKPCSRRIRRTSSLAT